MIHSLPRYSPPRFGQVSPEPRPVKRYDDYLCHCFDKTEEELTRRIQLDQLSTVKEVQQKTEAGTGCGACVRKIKCLLERLVKPAESPVKS